MGPYEDFELLEDDPRDAGYCEHGVYVGGIGVDWMCMDCELGTPWEDYVLGKQLELRRLHSRRRMQDFAAHLAATTAAGHGHIVEQYGVPVLLALWNVKVR